MRRSYQDILSRIKDPPLWYDQDGTPRYAPFSFELCPDIYSHHVGLFRVCCQLCHKEFLVEMHANIFDHRIAAPPAKWHYGDPPIHDCPAGNTMNCNDLAVVEFWVEDKFEWTRRPEFEGPIDAG